MTDTYSTVRGGLEYLGDDPAYRDVNSYEEMIVTDNAKSVEVTFDISVRPAAAKNGYYFFIGGDYVGTFPSMEEALAAAQTEFGYAIDLAVVDAHDMEADNVK